MDRQNFERVVPELRLKLQRIVLFYLADDAALHPVLFTECPFIAQLSLNNRIHNALFFFAKKQIVTQINRKVQQKPISGKIQTTSYTSKDAFLDFSFGEWRVFLFICAGFAECGDCLP